jgi:DNA-binding NarL/FixJ family response regulator
MSPSPARQDWIQRSVGAEPGIRIVGRAATFPYLRSLISETSADLVVIDLQSSMESTVVREWLAELLDLVAALLLSSEPDPAITDLLWNEKTGGLLSAEASSVQIIQAMRSVASGLMVFDSSLIRPNLRDTGDAPLTESLTPRESEVLGLLADGLSNREIAQRLNISEHTIKFHIRSILGKLGASSRTEAVSRGLRSGLIEL